MTQYLHRTELFTTILPRLSTGHKRKSVSLRSKGGAEGCAGCRDREKELADIEMQVWGFGVGGLWLG
jgi:hypothetical protein